MLREGNKFILAIREVLIEDSGIFTCRATNPAGVAECSAELFVEGLRINSVSITTFQCTQVYRKKVIIYIGWPKKWHFLYAL